MEYVAIWLSFGLVAAIIASSKGRSVGGWFFLGLLLGPFSLVVGFLPSISSVSESRAQRIGESGDYKKCPFCAEVVRREAIKCKHCGSEIPATPIEQEEPKPPLKQQKYYKDTWSYKAGLFWAKMSGK